MPTATIARLALPVKRHHDPKFHIHRSRRSAPISLSPLTHVHVMRAHQQPEIFRQLRRTFPATFPPVRSRKGNCATCPTIPWERAPSPSILPSQPATIWCFPTRRFDHVAQISFCSGRDSLCCAARGARRAAGKFLAFPGASCGPQRWRALLAAGWRAEIRHLRTLVDPARDSFADRKHLLQLFSHSAAEASAGAGNSRAGPSED